MKVYQSAFVALLVLSVIGDVSHFINSLGASPGSELSMNSYSLISGADAFSAIAGTIARVLVMAASGHRKNRRPSNKNKHQRGDRRRQNDQRRSDGQKGAKGRSKKRG